jgi:cell wall-associated NlpC family hydrolase
VSAQSVKRPLLAGALLLALASCPLVEQQATHLRPVAASVATTPKAPQLESIPGSGLLAAARPSASPSASSSAKPKQKIAVGAAASADLKGGRQSKVRPASAKDVKAGTDAQTALSFALDQLGKPYVWGAEGPDTYDCSGLTMRAYESAGYQLPRTAAQQSMVGTPVDVADLLPGDLLFYATDPSDLSTVHHVVMYAGAGLVVHAPHTGDVVRLGPMWLGDEYAGAVRIVDAAAAVPVKASVAKPHPRPSAAPRPSHVPVAHPTRSPAKPGRPSSPSSPSHPGNPSSPSAPATPAPTVAPTPTPTPTPSVTPEAPTPTEVAPSITPGLPTPTTSSAGVEPSVVTEERTAVVSGF